MSAQSAKKVLLVDDDEVVLDHLQSAISSAGYTVLTAQDSKTALECMQQEFAPIVILDVNLPDMDGLTLCRTIRRQKYPGYTYLMLHSIKDAEEDILAGLDAGADDYMSKKTSPAQILARLRLVAARECLAVVVGGRLYAG